MTDQSAPLRIDKWLWYARFFKSRALASRMVSSGRLQIDGDAVSKPHRHVQVGQTLIFPQGEVTRTIEVRALTTRRGPATEAQALYHDLDPPQKKDKSSDKQIIPAFEVRDAGSGRPTKRDRRLSDALKQNL